MYVLLLPLKIGPENCINNPFVLQFKPETCTPKSEKGGKSGGMTITISSIKTNPTIVSNSVSDSSPETKKSGKPKRGSVTSPAGVKQGLQHVQQGPV